MQSITPFLWFDNNAEAAMEFYTSIFADSEILDSGRFRLLGQEFMVLNGGPMFQFNEAVSFFVSCDTQEEVDELWEKLTADGGTPGRCGWLKDKFGLSWQVIPKVLGELFGGADREAAGRAVQAMMGMGKIEVEGLRRAYEGG